MTSPPSRPNPRRRRVVVTIAVVVVGLCWWFWPRVDQRFVGTWRVDSTNEQVGPHVLVFTADGWGKHQLMPSDYPVFPNESPFRWWFESDGRLVLHNPVHSGVKEALEFWRWRILGDQAPFAVREYYEIVSVTRHEIVLRFQFAGEDGDPSEELDKLRRLSD